MIHPSYVELMKVVNDDVVIGEEPVVNSRYSIVCAAAKRARQLIDGSEPLIEERRAYNRKPLSIAVDELFEGKLKILTKEEALVEQGKLDSLSEKTKEVRLRVEALHMQENESKEKEARKTVEKRDPEGLSGSGESEMTQVDQSGTTESESVEAAVDPSVRE